jgi:hypothetical protein
MSNHNQSRGPVYVVNVLINYAPGCDPLGVDDWCDEVWCATEEEARDMVNAFKDQASDTSGGERGVASVSIDIQSDRNREELDTTIFLENCRCHDHGGTTSEEEVESLAYAFNLGSYFLKIQKEVIDDDQNLFGPSSLRTNRAMEIYDETFEAEINNGKSSDESNVVAIAAVNQIITLG